PAAAATSTLALHDALPIFAAGAGFAGGGSAATGRLRGGLTRVTSAVEKDRTSFDPAGRTWMKSPSAGSPSAMTLPERPSGTPTADRKSTRLNSSHVKISYA